MTRPHRHSRRGISTLWVVLTIPVFLTLLVFTVDIANLWLARVELENGLEAAALAAVREWGEAGGGSTEVPRQVGVAYAQANLIRGMPISIATNYNENTTNQNAACCQTPSPNPNGNLVFGAISDVNGNGDLTFNTIEEPACGIGTILFDTTGNNLDIENAWGVSFYDTPETPETLTIESITFYLPATQLGVFAGDAHVSQRVVGGASPTIIRCQPDVYGLDPSHVHFERLDPASDGTGYRTLKITFAPGTFLKGYRFRFGVPTDKVGGNQGNELDDGDGVGADRVRVAVVFAGSDSPVYATFVDTAYKQSECTSCSPPNSGPEPKDLHPLLLPDLPCPATSAAPNDGQSFVLMRGAGQNDFGVRAQATVSVNSIARKLLGDCIGPYYVTAKVTARYSCSEDRAWLVRIKNFICTTSTP